MTLYIVSAIVLIALTVASLVIATRRPNTWVDVIAGSLGLLAAGVWVAVNVSNQGPILINSSVIRIGAYDLLALPLIFLSALLVGRTGFMMEARSTIGRQQEH